MTVSFKCSKKDFNLVLKIAARAFKEIPELKEYTDKTTLEMDLIACHANYCRLDFKKLLKARFLDLLHDCGGISGTIDRETGKLRDNFLPEFFVRKVK